MNKINDVLRDWHVYLAVFLAGTLLYAKSLTFGFTYVDDVPLLVVNQDFLSNLANLPKLFTMDVFIAMPNPFLYYRPLLNILFMLEMQTAKDAPIIYHITNILLHVGCSFLLYRIFVKTGLTRLIAGMAALVFCVHPVNTSAVVWIPGRNDTLMTLFMLGSFLLFLRALETQRAAAFAGHAFLFLLALLTKESALFIPVLCISYAFIFFKEKRYPKNKILAASIVYIMITAFWIFLRNLVPQNFEVHRTGIWYFTNWLNNLPAFLLYLGKFFFPINCSVYPNLSDNTMIIGVIVIFLLIIISFLRTGESRKSFFWGLAWCFLFLVPSLFQGPIFYEHRAYGSFVWFLFALAGIQPVREIDFSKIVNLIAFILLIVLLSVFSAMSAGHYRDRFSFAVSAIDSAPSITQSYSGLAGLYLDEEKFEAAEYIIRKGIARDPNMNIMHRMLGDVYASRGEYSHAEEEYQISLRLEPLHLPTYAHYGKMCLDLGKTDTAIKLFKTAVQINPEYILGYYYLINSYIYSKNDPDSAVVYAREIQKRGIAVMPELMQAIERHPMYRKFR
jgi:protein O-mannosyl-transferase